MSVGEFFLQETDEGLGRRRPGEAMTCGDTVPWGREETLDGFPDGVGIIGVEVGGCIATDFMQYGNVGHQHRAATAHGLDGWQTKPFIERGKDKAYGLVVKTHQLFVGDSTEVTDNGLHGFSGFISLFRSEHPMAGAHDVEFAIGNVLKGLNETVEILAGVKG